MAGTSLQNNGDVQIGTDAAYLACPGTITGFNPSSYVRALDFNPWVWPDILSDDTPMWSRTGVRPGADIPTGRRMQLTVEVHEANYSNLQTKMKALMSAVKPQMTAGVEQELAFMYGGTKYVLYGRYREVDVQDTSRAGFRTMRVRISFLATDPVIYECALQTANVPVYTFAMTGWENPASTAANVATVKAAISPPNISITGDAPPRYTLQLRGAARNPVFMNCTDNQWMWLADSGGYTLSSGSYAMIHWNTRRVLNTVDVDITYLHSYPSHWVELKPGSGTLNELAIAQNVNFNGSAAMPAGINNSGTLVYQRGWWML